LAIEQLRLRLPGDTWLIPVRFNDCTIPDIELGGGRTLASIQRCDLFGEYDVGVTRLVVAILRVLERRSANRGPEKEERRDEGRDRGRRRPPIITEAEFQARRATTGPQFGSRPEVRGDSLSEPKRDFSKNKPLVIPGQASKVLELNLPPGTYRMSWATEGKGLFTVRNESARKGAGSLIVSVATPNPDSGEQVVRISDSGRQILSVEAPKLRWALTFVLLSAQEVSLTVPAEATKLNRSAPGSVAGRAPGPTLGSQLNELTQCLRQLTVCNKSISKLVDDATAQLNRTLTSRGKLNVNDRLAEKIAPIVEEYSLQAKNYQRIMPEVDQGIRTRLEAIKALPREQWTDSIPGALASFRKLAESGLRSSDSLRRQYDCNDNLRRKIGSSRLHEPLRQLQSAIMMASTDPGVFRFWLKELQELGY
jgi:hypothetical protein